MISYHQCFVMFISFLISLPVFSEEKVPTPSVSIEDSILPMFLGLAGIICLIVILASIMKKLTGLNVVSNNINIIESQNIGTKEKLVIVEIQNQQYVLGVTAHSINQICQLTEPVVKKDPMPSFDNVMQKFLSPQKTTAEKKQSGSH